MKTVTFKIGEWVKLTESVNSGASQKKGTIGVVSSKIKSESNGWSSMGARFGDKWHYVVFGSNSYYARVSINAMKKIATPKFAVAYATEDNDPVERFETLSEARAFKKKILGKRLRGDKIIEANIYVLSK